MDYSTMYSYLKEELNHSHEEALHAVAVKAVQLSIEMVNKKGDRIPDKKIYEFMEERVKTAFWETEKDLLSNSRFISTCYDPSKAKRWKESLDALEDKAA